MKNKVLFVFLVLLNISCAYQKPATVSPEPFLKDGYEAKSFLERSLASVPEGAIMITSPEDIESLNVKWPGDTLIKEAAENQPWTNHSYYHFVLDLKDADLIAYKETDSSRMLASILLDHYFASLEEINFNVASEPHTFISYPLQYASNTWFMKQYNIIITGSVFINIEYKNALIIADVAEVFRQ